MTTLLAPLHSDTIHTKVSPITILLHSWRQGETQALDELMPLIYGELQRIAAAHLRRANPNHPLEVNALVHEAHLKLFAGAPPEFADRVHFFAVASRAMRQVLVDYARSESRAKRGGGGRPVTLDTSLGISGPAISHDLLTVNAALEDLARESPDLAQLVEMRFFAGMTAEESAQAVGRSAHAVRHDLRLAQAWLRRHLGGSAGNPR